MGTCGLHAGGRRGLESKSRPPDSLCVWEGEEPSEPPFWLQRGKKAPIAGCSTDPLPGGRASTFTQPRAVLGLNPGVLGAWEERTV